MQSLYSGGSSSSQEPLRDGDIKYAVELRGGGSGFQGSFMFHAELESCARLI
jgi:hypothetical protein